MQEQKKKSFLLAHSFSDIFQLPQTHKGLLETFQTYFEHCYENGEVALKKSSQKNARRVCLLETLCKVDFPSKVYRHFLQKLTISNNLL